MTIGLTLQTYKYEFLLILVTLIASAGWLFTKLALMDFTPYLFLSIRFLLASAVLFLLCKSDLFRLSREQTKRAFATGCLLGISMLSWILAVASAESIGQGAFIISLTIVFVPPINYLLFKELIPHTLIVALIPATIGLAMLSINFDGSSTANLVSKSNMLFLLSTLGFAVHIVLTGKYAKSIATMPLTTIQLFCVGVIAAVAGLLTESIPAEIPASAWGWLLLSALIATSLRFSLQTKVLEKVSINNAAILMLLEPIWTTVLGAYFLGERMTLQQLSGCGLILFALLVYRGPVLAQLWKSLVRKLLPKQVKS